jgi:hypothetical protein
VVPLVAVVADSVALAVLVAVEASVAVVLVAVVASVAVSAVDPVAADSNQNVSRNQEFVSFCKNNSNFACKCVIN